MDSGEAPVAMLGMGNRILVALMGLSMLAGLLGVLGEYLGFWHIAVEALGSASMIGPPETIAADRGLWS